MTKLNFANALDRSLKPAAQTFGDEVFGFDLPPLPAQESPSQIVEVVPDGAIVPQGDGTFAVGEFTLTPVGVQIPEGTSADSWSALGDVLLQLNGAIQWLIGDWLNYGTRAWGKTYDEVAAATGYEVSTLYNLAFVCGKVHFSLRNEKLTFTHHMLVAGKPPAMQQYWLTKAAVGGWTSAQMRQAMKEKPPALPMNANAGDVQNTLISSEKPQELRQFLKVAIKAGQGDAKAKQRALGQIAQFRRWLDDVEEWITS
jgi:hypothetical protein